MSKIILAKVWSFTDQDVEIPYTIEKKDNRFKCDCPVMIFSTRMCKHVIAMKECVAARSENDYVKFTDDGKKYFKLNF